jgi:hypothetical protein
MPENLLAYIGIGPGQELFAYFLTLLGIMGAALLAVLQWPITLVTRLFRRSKNTAPEQIAEPPGLEKPSPLGSDVRERGNGTTDNQI